MTEWDAGILECSRKQRTICNKIESADDPDALYVILEAEGITEVERPLLRDSA